MASENGAETKGTQESDNDTENDSEETESSSPETSTNFHSKSPCEHCENSNVYSTLIMQCSKCFWHDNYTICPICDHQISEERKYIKEGFLRCLDCGLITHKNAKTLETSFYSPSHWFSIKFLKLYLVSCQFICCVLKLILVKLLIVCAFTIISQGAPLGLAVEMNNLYSTLGLLTRIIN